MRSEFVTPDWKPLSFAGLPSFSRVSLILRGFSDIFSDTRLTRFGVRSGIRARGNWFRAFALTTYYAAGAASLEFVAFVAVASSSGLV